MQKAQIRTRHCHTWAEILSYLPKICGGQAHSIEFFDSTARFHYITIVSRPQMDHDDQRKEGRNHEKGEKGEEINNSSNCCSMN